MLCYSRQAVVGDIPYLNANKYSYLSGYSANTLQGDSRTSPSTDAFAETGGGVIQTTLSLAPLESSCVRIHELTQSKERTVEPDEGTLWTKLVIPWPQGVQ